MSIGCIARPGLLMAFGVIARFTARPGCTARRTLRGTRSRVRNLMRSPSKPEIRGNSAHEWPPSAARIPDDAALSARPSFEPARRDASRAYVTVRIQAMTPQLARIDGLLADLHRGVRWPGQPIRQHERHQPPCPPGRPTSHQTPARSPLITDANSASADPSPRSSRPASNASAEGWQPRAALADSSAASGRSAPRTRARSVAVKAEQTGPLVAPAAPGWPCRSRGRRGQFSG